MDSLTLPTGEQVDPKQIAEEEVLHISIPSFDATGGGTLEPAASIGSAKMRLRGGELLVSKLNPRKPRVLLVEPSYRTIVASGEFIALRPRGVDPSFLRWRLVAEDLRQHLDSQVRSVTRSHQRIEPGRVLKTWLAVPPLDEQRHIASFLDRELQDLDLLASATRRQLALLRERHRSYIESLIDAPLAELGAPFRDSLAPDWQVTQLRRVTQRLVTGATPPTNEPRYYAEGSIPWYSPSSFGADIALNQPAKHLHRSAVDDGVVRTLPRGCTLVVTIGATLGRVAELTVPASTNQQVTAAIPSPAIDNRFLAWQLKAREDLLRGTAAATTLPILTQEALGSFPIVLPPLLEQRQVADALDESANSLRAASQALEDRMTLLNERRQALITAAVTGELDPSSYRRPRELKAA